MARTAPQDCCARRFARRAAGRVLLVGDAAGYIDALTGEGMGLAFGAAELVVNCVVRPFANGPRITTASGARMTRRYRASTAALIHASTHAPLRAGIVPAAQTLPSVFVSLSPNLLAQ